MKYHFSGFNRKKRSIAVIRHAMALMMIVTRDPKTMIQNKCQEEYISQPKHERQKKVNDFCYCILPKSQGGKTWERFLQAHDFPF